MTAFALIFTLVVIVEALVEYFGTPIPSAYKPYVAAALGVVLCLVYGADLLALLGYPASVPYVGSALTGLLISRGSNVFNDLVSRLNVVHTRAADAMNLADGVLIGVVLALLVLLVIWWATGDS